MADAEKKKKTKKKETAEAAPAAPSGGSSGGSKKQAQRRGSSVFSMFSQRQVQEFKEAFGFMDADKDGLLSKNDLRASYDALGKIVAEKELDEMLSEAPGPVNFTMMLTIFGNRIGGMDEEDVIMKAFQSYDDGEGKCPVAKLKKDLMQWGERFSQNEIDEVFESAPVDGSGMLDLKGLCNLLTKGAEEEEGG